MVVKYECGHCHDTVLSSLRPKGWQMVIGSVHIAGELEEATAYLCLSCSSLLHAYPVGYSISVNGVVAKAARRRI